MLISGFRTQYPRAGTESDLRRLFFERIAAAPGHYFLKIPPAPGHSHLLCPGILKYSLIVNLFLIIYVFTIGNTETRYYCTPVAIKNAHFRVSLPKYYRYQSISTA
eukprot:scaffold11583_cov45-Attheya_sp.AAC.1